MSISFRKPLGQVIDQKFDTWQRSHSAIPTFAKVKKLITTHNKNSWNYYGSLSFFLYKNMTVVLLLHPKINCMTIPLVVPVKIFRTIPLCGNFSNHISRTFLNHSSHWFKLNGYIMKWSYHPLIEDKCQYPYKKKRTK